MSTPAPQILHVTSEHAGETILAILRAWQPGQSWGAVRQLLSRRHVQINGNLCLDEGRRLKEGEVVRLLPFSAAPPPTEDDVKIRYLDQHLVVVEKPAGMTTLRHPEERDWPRSRKQLQPTLDEVLPRIIDRRERGGRRGPPGQPSRETAPRQKGPLRRLRAVHRLDRETSGLMVFARTIDAERELGLQFRAHSLARVYLAVVAGNLPHEETYQSFLIEDRGDGRRGSTSNPKLGKEAITHVQPIERLGKYTVVECRLETGRTHQIRIHLSEAGYPLCGDKVYRGKFPGTPLPDVSGAPRVALHAAELGFEHPITGEYLHHAMALPVDMVELIDRLSGGRRGPVGRGGRVPQNRAGDEPGQEASAAAPAPRAGGRGKPVAEPRSRGNRPGAGRYSGGRRAATGPKQPGRGGLRRDLETGEPGPADDEFLAGGGDVGERGGTGPAGSGAGTGSGSRGNRSGGGRRSTRGRTPGGGRLPGKRPAGGGGRVREAGVGGEAGAGAEGGAGESGRQPGRGGPGAKSSRPGGSRPGGARPGGSRSSDSRPGGSRPGKKPKRRRPGPPRG